jgi:hypothetical protein
MQHLRLALVSQRSTSLRRNRVCMEMRSSGVEISLYRAYEADLPPKELSRLGAQAWNTGLQTICIINVNSEIRKTPLGSYRKRYVVGSTSANTGSVLTAACNGTAGHASR